MNKRSVRVTLLVATMALAVLLVAGCDLFGEAVTIEGRIQQLESDLNNNYSRVYTNWHPETTTRQAAVNPDALNTFFPPGEAGSYRFSNIAPGSASATAKLTSTATHDNRDVSFTMKEDAGVWYILSLSASGLPTLSSVE